MFLPKGGVQDSKPIEFQGQTIKLNYYLVRDGYSIYGLTWATGPNGNATDTEAIKSALAGIYEGMTKSFRASHLTTEFVCEPAGERNISGAGYIGREFELTSCPIRGMARIYTKIIGTQRQVYVGYVFSNEMETNVSKFMNSFRVAAPKVRN